MAISEDPALMRLLTKLHGSKGLGFTQRKKPTASSAISSRLRAGGVESCGGHIKILESKPGERDRERHA
jgi:hypothetical protein